MDRKRALEIFGLREDATSETIVKRYNVLVKKFRYTDASDIGFTREELDEAYKLLMGIEYRDPEEERRKKARQQKPNPVLKALGIDYDRLSNFLYYYKWTILICILAVVFVIWIVSSFVNRVDPDFKLIIAGEIYVRDIDAFEGNLKVLINTNEPQAQHIPISDRVDPAVLPAYEEKLTVEIMAGENDVFILDMALYNRLAPFGIFVPLDDRLEELGGAPYDESLLISAQAEDGEEPRPPRMYGVDVTGSSILEEQGVTGDRMIAAIMVNAEHAENAVEYIKTLVESVRR
ncbi:MAG TPA: hypothetical protein PK369_00565 [Thermoclostridium sp.]|nr:hypothetical protein [Thermoclostridium sp.]HPU44769.1 hypothetical protein [Thermoclostridium sp.]